MVVIASDALSAEIVPMGAELQRLTTADGTELLWDGDPAWWSGRAPVLFPVVGKVSGSIYRWGGRQWPMPKHGFARETSCEMTVCEADRVAFRLEDSAETRALYPFAFALEMAFAIEGATLAMTATIFNTGDGPLPASFGFHPAFRWPLGDAERSAHKMVFEHPEPAPIRRVNDDGFLLDAPVATPMQGDTLWLTDDLFTNDAVIFDRLTSRRLRYGAAGGRMLEIAFPDTPMLGVWTKPGAPFVCVEPWQGIADPAGYTGEFVDKPGMIQIAPGERRAFRMSVSVV